VSRRFCGVDTFFLDSLARGYEKWFGHKPGQHPGKKEITGDDSQRLSYKEICAKLADNDPAKFNEIWQVEYVFGLWMLKNKIEKSLEDKIEMYRMHYANMDWIAGCFTGKNTKLLEAFNNKISTPTINKKLTMEEKIKAEEKMLAGLGRLGFKVK